MAAKENSPNTSLLLIIFILVCSHILYEKINSSPQDDKNASEVFAQLIDAKIYQSKLKDYDNTTQKTKAQTSYTRGAYTSRGRAIDLSNIDTLKLTPELLDAVGAHFPYIHGILIPFKETSFCRDNKPGIHPTFCNDEWEHIIGVDWNPHNAGGMKFPKYRSTTALCSIGDMLRSFQDKYDLKISKRYNYLLDDPHACFASWVDYAIDVKLWQEHWFKAKGKQPKTRMEYLMFLKEVGYNPYDHYYYDEDGSGICQLLDALEKGTFKKKYNRYYKQRMYLDIPNKLPKHRQQQK